MTSRRIVFTAALLVVTAAFAVAADEGPASVDQAWKKAMLAQDVNAIANLYAPDAVMYSPDSMVLKGREAIRKDYEELLKTMRVVSADLSDTHYETHGDVGLAHGHFTLKMAPKAGGDTVTMEGRFTSVAKKIGGKWQYVVDHASVPMPPPPTAAPPAK
jgi:uncharacterized protein (TIGR02246 family)